MLPLAVDFAVAAAGALEPGQLNACGNGGMAFSRCRRQATAAKTTAQEKESCWILLLLAPAAVGASLRSPMRLTGCCCRATRTLDQQHCSTTKELLLWGGASLRSPMRLTGCCCGGSCCCYAKAGTAEGRAHKKTTTAAQQKSCFFGVGLRCARHVCSAATRRSPWEESFRASGLPGIPNPPLPLLPLPFSSPSAFPPASVGFPVPQLFIIVPFYKY